MKRRYQPRPLSQAEAEMFVMVLMEEIEIQAWYSITYIASMGEEVLLTLN